MIPNVDIRSLEILKFILLYKLKQPYSEVMNMSYYQAKKLQDNYKAYLKGAQDNINKDTK